jgi:hypothetical protein
MTARTLAAATTGRDRAPVVSPAATYGQSENCPASKPRLSKAGFFVVMALKEAQQSSEEQCLMKVWAQI